MRAGISNTTTQFLANWAKLSQRFQDVLDAADWSLVEFAVEHNHPLLEHCLADGSCQSASPMDFVGYLTGKTDQGEEPDIGGATLAHWAAEYHRYDLLMALVDPQKGGANPEQEDTSERTVLTIAIGSSSREVNQWAKTWGAFLGKYRLISLVVHSSGTCLVIFAKEIATGRLLALKLMHNKEEWLREQEMRKLADGTLLDAKHVVPLLHWEELEKDAGLIDNRLEGENKNLFLLVMPQAKHDLSDVLSHSRFAGRERMKVIEILEQVAGHLKYLNEICHRIHGDLKPRNLIQLEMQDDSGVTVLVWVLIDLDASCEIGSAAGQKITSSAYYPPEMARQELARSHVAGSGSGDDALSAREMELNELIAKNEKELDALEAAPRKQRDKSKINELNAVIEQLEAELNHAGNAEPVVASVGFEMWYFGCLLYQLCTLDGATLWDANQADNIEDDQLRQLAYQWPEIKTPKMKRIVWPEAKELAEWLLQEDVNDRPHSWDQVLEHPFITGKDGQKLIMEKLTRIEQGVENIQAQMTNVLRGIEVVRNTIINLDACPIPTVFVIEPQPIMSAADIDGTADEAKCAFSKFAGIFNTSNPVESTKQAIDEFSKKKMTLRLVCQYTGEAIGDGFEIEQPRNVLPQLLPLMSVGLKAMKAVNGVSKLGRLFGLPAPEIPSDWVQSVENMVDGLEDSGFYCVAQAAGTNTQGDLQELSAFQQREFAAFLKEKDPHETWKDVLVRVALKETGYVMWVCKAAHEHLEKKSQLDTLLPAEKNIIEEQSYGRPAADTTSQSEVSDRVATSFNVDGPNTDNIAELLLIQMERQSAQIEQTEKLVSLLAADRVATTSTQLKENHTSASEAVASATGLAVDPEAWVKKKVMDKAMAAVRKVLEPVLKAKGLVWEDASPALELMDTVDEVTAAVQDPESFLEQLAQASHPLAVKIVLSKLRPVLEPVLSTHGLTWEDVRPVAELLTADELTSAVDRPEVFLEDLVQKSEPFAKAAAISKLQAVLEPLLMDTHGLTWDDVLPALRLATTLEELSKAIEEPTAFLMKIKDAGGPVGKKILLVGMRKQLEPLLKKRKISWQVAMSSMDHITGGVEMDELKKIATASASAHGLSPQEIEPLLDHLERYTTVIQLRDLEDEAHLEENRMHDRTDGSKACAIC